MSTSPSWFDQEKFSRLVKKVGPKSAPAPEPAPAATGRICPVIAEILTSQSVSLKARRRRSPRNRREVSSIPIPSPPRPPTFRSPPSRSLPPRSRARFRLSRAAPRRCRRLKRSFQSTTPAPPRQPRPARISALHGGISPPETSPLKLLQTAHKEDIDPSRRRRGMEELSAVWHKNGPAQRGTQSGHS